MKKSSKKTEKISKAAKNLEAKDKDKKSLTGKDEKIDHLVWDFTDMYSGIDDPKIETDIKAVESLCATFSKKYKSSGVYLNDSSEGDAALLDAIKGWESLSESIGTAKPLFYPEQ
jgi:hypothetical protein